MTERKNSTSEKHQALDRLLEHEYVLVHVDPEVKDVLLPPHLMSRSSVTLKLSRLFRGVLDLQADKVEVELLFDQRYFTCSIPMAAIWGMTGFSGENLLWPETTPEQVLKQLLQKEEIQSSDQETTESKEIKKGHLRRVK